MSTVLIVDDDPKFVCAAERMLTNEGYCVLLAFDGRQAVEVLDHRHREIDLAIVDLSLPGINGFEIIGAISRRPNALKIIATTSVYKDAYLAMAGTLGAHAAIRKPPDGKPLPERDWLATVRRLIESAEQEKGTQVPRARGNGNNSEPMNGSESNA